jgi:hypothetical protein
MSSNAYDGLSEQARVEIQQAQKILAKNRETVEAMHHCGKQTGNRGSATAFPRAELARNLNSADYQCEVVMKRIKDFEDNLDDEHEVGIKLASFGETVLLNVTNITFSNPSVLIFHGTVNDCSATLIQHLSMLDFLLLAVPKSETSRRAHRIGFALPDEE